MDSLLSISGERLILRRLRPEDLSAFQAYRTDPEIARLQGWSIATDAESLAFITRMYQVPHFVPGQWFQLGVALRQSDHIIGDVGVCAHDHERVELGFSINAAYHRQGFGTEAVRLAIDYVTSILPVCHIEAQADVRNEASWRLLERVGMTRRGQRCVVYKGEPCEEYLYALELAAHRMSVAGEAAKKDGKR